MRISLKAVARVAVAAAIAAGCGDTSGSGVSPGSLGTAAEYEALALVTPQYEAPLCAEPERCAFGQRAYGTVGANGDAVVSVSAEDLPPIVRVDGASGRITPIGRLGTGPGEYRAPALQELTADGGLVVLDIFGRRWLRYGPSGSAQQTSVIQIPKAPMYAASMGNLVNGNLHMLGADDSETPGDSMPISLFVLRPDAEPLALRALDLRMPVLGLGRMVEPPGIFAANVQFVVAEAGEVFLTRGVRLVVEHYDSTGQLAAMAGFDIAGRRVSDADVERYRSRFLSSNVPPGMREALNRQMAARAEQHPAVTLLQRSADGHLWLKRTPREAGDSVEWLVLDRELRPHRRVWLAADDVLIGAANGRVLIARLADDSGEDGYWWARLP